MMIVSLIVLMGCAEERNSAADLTLDTWHDMGYSDDYKSRINDLNNLIDKKYALLDDLSLTHKQRREQLAEIGLLTHLTFTLEQEAHHDAELRKIQQRKQQMSQY